MALSQDTSEDLKDSKEVFDKIEFERLLLDFESDEVRVVRPDSRLGLGLASPNSDSDS